MSEDKSERFRAMQAKSVEARRSKKQQKPGDSTGDKLTEAMRRYIEQDPDEAVRVLLKTARGIDAVLSHGAGLFSEQKQPEKTIIVIESPFLRRNSRVTVERWLQLLRRRELEQLEVELEVHSEPVVA